MLQIYLIGVMEHHLIPTMQANVPERVSQFEQPSAPQQVDGNVRPLLTRIDSRVNLNVRLGFPNPLLRPQLSRPPPPGGTPFVQRPLIQQQRPPLAAQNLYPRQPVSHNIIPTTRPQITPGFRPTPPNFGRPPLLTPRPQNIYQQRSFPLPTTTSKPTLSNNLTKSQTLDSYECNSSQEDNVSAIEAANNEEEEQTEINLNDEFQKDQKSSVGDVEDENLIPDLSRQIEQNPRPETRMEGRMDNQPLANNSREELNKATTNLQSNPPSPQPYMRRAHVTRTPSPTQENPTTSSPKQSASKRAEKPKSPNLLKNDRKSPETKTRSSSKLRLYKAEGDNDSGVDESTQGNDHLNSEYSTGKKSSKSSTPRSATTPTKNKSFTRVAKSPNPKSPETPTSTADKKKVPMNKIQVGSAPSPNLKVVKSKIGSLENATHKPGGGNIKIESKKIDFSTTSSRVTAKNDTYLPGGGDKKIQQQKLNWSAKSKVGSLENTTHKPKGGDKKIDIVKLDFKENAKSKVGSKDNIKHVPGGGDVKSESEHKLEEIRRDIETKKVDIKVQSKIGSLDNIKHKPGGGDKKIYDDKGYLRQMSAHSNASLDGSQKKKLRPLSLELASPAVSSPVQQKVKILDEVEVYEITHPEAANFGCSSSRGKRSPISNSRPPWRY
ncbi:microtubule-associated protein 4-like isoform X3 [Photinus pyralis]|uniref:microtubule-associated protein 4-like isoform X3 n=1 Tax=Photinus pyralis TaxID=7054 RepID=UPI001266F594|nr:microtubule-associated protein 4-like isoform X3 [Photinus pyralis]